jgi:hypothetical protein
VGEALPEPEVEPAQMEAPAVEEQPAEETPMPTPSTAPFEQPKVEEPAVMIRGKLIVRSSGDVITLPLDKTEMTIGRSDPVRNIFPDIDLTRHGGDTAGVSRMHARLILQGSQLYVEDLNSTNYTFINRQRLQPGQPTVLKSGDEIRFGLLAVSYVSG